MLRIVIIILLFLSLAGCSKKTPNRDYIPELRNQLYKLQVAIADKNNSAIDSLLSVQILDIDQSSDSLLSFVYGPNNDFQFVQLGNYEIFYTDDKARIDCFIMDSLALQERPITLTYVHEHNMWLLKRFEPQVEKAEVHDVNLEQ